MFSWAAPNYQYKLFVVADSLLINGTNFKPQPAALGKEVDGLVGKALIQGIGVSRLMTGWF